MATRPETIDRPANLLGGLWPHARQIAEPGKRHLFDLENDADAGLQENGVRPSRYLKAPY